MKILLLITAVTSLSYSGITQVDSTFKKFHFSVEYNGLTSVFIKELQPNVAYGCEFGFSFPKQDKVRQTISIGGVYGQFSLHDSNPISKHFDFLFHVNYELQTKFKSRSNIFIKGGLVRYQNDSEYAGYTHAGSYTPGYYRKSNFIGFYGRFGWRYQFTKWLSLDAYAGIITGWGKFETNQYTPTEITNGLFVIPVGTPGISLNCHF